MLSIFTPTNNVRWLRDAYTSLQHQTYRDWEWVIVPNHGPTYKDVTTALGIECDDRVRIVATEMDGVGALKRFACGECRGDMFVELDHDDQLPSYALQSLYDASVKTPDAFYFSDFVNVKPDGRNETYATHWGWEAYQWRDNDKTEVVEEHTAMRAFDASARSLCEIYYAPNHVRAWSKFAYELTGGYDASMDVADDHDILCRTYLSGVPMVHIDSVLYCYRIHADRTSIRDNAKIQERQRANMNRYIYPLIYEECRRRCLPLIDLGHVSIPRQGFTAKPVFRGGQIDLSVLDSLEDNSVGCFWASDVLQRIIASATPAFFNTVYQKLAPGGWLLCQTPSTDDGEGRAGRGAFQDPGHVSYWNSNSAWYYTHRDYARHLPNYKGRFQLVRTVVNYASDWHRSNFIPYVTYDMYALKGQRAPGLTTI